MNWNYTIDETKNNSPLDLAKEIIELVSPDGYGHYNQYGGYENIHYGEVNITHNTKLHELVYASKNYGDIIVKVIERNNVDVCYNTVCDIMIGDKQFLVDSDPKDESERYFSFNYMTCEPETEEYVEISDTECLVKDLKYLCEALLDMVETIGVKHGYRINTYMLQYTLDYIQMVEDGEFVIDDFFNHNDSYYYSAHTRAHYFDDPEPRPNPYKDPEFDEEFWEAVENRMEK